MKTFETSYVAKSVITVAENDFCGLLIDISFFSNAAQLKGMSAPPSLTPSLTV